MDLKRSIKVAEMSKRRIGLAMAKKPIVEAVLGGLLGNIFNLPAVYAETIDSVQRNAVINKTSADNARISCINENFSEVCSFKTANKFIDCVYIKNDPEQRIDKEGAIQRIDDLMRIYQKNNCAYYLCTIAYNYIIKGQFYRKENNPKLQGYAEASALEYGEPCLKETKFVASARTQSLVAQELPRREAARKVETYSGVGWGFVGLGAALLVPAITLNVLQGRQNGMNTCVFDGIQGPCAYEFTPVFAAGYGIAAASLGTGLTLLLLGRKLHIDYHKPSYTNR